MRSLFLFAVCTVVAYATVTCNIALDIQAVVYDTSESDWTPLVQIVLSNDTALDRVAQLTTTQYDSKFFVNGGTQLAVISGHKGSSSGIYVPFAASIYDVTTGALVSSVDITGDIPPVSTLLDLVMLPNGVMCTLISGDGGMDVWCDVEGGPTKFETPYGYVNHTIYETTSFASGGVGGNVTIFNALAISHPPNHIAPTPTHVVDLVTIDTTTGETIGSTTYSGYFPLLRSNSNTYFHVHANGSASILAVSPQSYNPLTTAPYSTGSSGRTSRTGTGGGGSGGHGSSSNGGVSSGSSNHYSGAAMREDVSDRSDSSSGGGGGGGSSSSTFTPPNYPTSLLLYNIASIFEDGTFDLIANITFPSNTAGEYPAFAMNDGEKWYILISATLENFYVFTVNNDGTSLEQYGPYYDPVYAGNNYSLPTDFYCLAETRRL